MTKTDLELRILLIEDDEDDYLITRDLLEEASPVRTLLEWQTTAERGISALCNGHYDAALIDLRLGPDSGLDVIRQAQAYGISTPYILLTGQGDDELDIKAVELGASDYLVKGQLDGHTLIRSIRYAIDRAMATEHLVNSEAYYRQLFENNPAPMVLADPESGHLQAMNQSARTLYQYSEENVSELTLTDLKSEDPEPINSEGVLLSPGAVLERHLTRDGAHLLIEVVSRKIIVNRSPSRLLTLSNVTEKITSNRQLRLLKRSIEASYNGISIAEAREPDMPLIYVNPAFERITGYAPEECIGRNCRFLQGDTFDLTNEHALADIRRGLLDGTDISVVLRNYRKDGTPFWNDLHVAPIRDDQGNITHFIGVQNDISERKSVESQLAFNVSHDVLTGLPNRTLLEDRLTQGCQFAKRYGRTLGLLFVDLDGFKLINDSMGHRLGDQLLIDVGQRLKSIIRSGDTVARISGDEFIVVLPDLAQANDVVMIVEKIIHNLSNPYHISDQVLRLTASIGITITDGKTDDPMALLQQADLAMYRAKQLGKNTYQWFSKDLNDQANFRVKLRNDLQDALENQQLTVYFQPIIDARSGKTRSVEALVRWEHPQQGLMSPGDFIPLAEETGQIIELGRQVLNQACQALVKLHARGFRECSVAVNVSPIQLRKDGFTGSVAAALKATGLAPQFLELEVVESVILYDTDTIVKTLQELRALGVRIAIDDFGTGFSSLSYIKLLPANKIKIDRSFIKDVIKNRSDAAITQGVISMAHHLNLEVVAEGVETEAHATFLRKQQCDLLQGFAFSRPIPFEALLKFLEAGSSAYELVLKQSNSEEDRPTLLLLDDEENILRALTRILRRDGYRILSTTSIPEAFNLLAENNVQVIISDQRMPEMSGTDFLSQVKTIHPNTVRIVLSGYTDLKSVTDAINEGAIYKFLTKPWDDKQIREHIQQAFQYYAAIQG
ncbi:EAL domain-containing protein [Marinobacter alexandrii]|uniref:EAL domain-containing protein n=2 Tax=Pseudomonadati TaxID=3379134 RepID=UPI001FFFFCDF|nr:EAL domain-containing protein [Marinobacter alexandrii]MCK2149265.1 EAL domain-containing protein [Marinobacter alexandrii]